MRPSEISENLHVWSDFKFPELPHNTKSQEAAGSRDIHTFISSANTQFIVSAFGQTVLML